MIRQRCGDPYLHNAALETVNNLRAKACLWSIESTCWLLQG
ncbi:hypothetical protein T06_5256 [Trichinella sp. T6]|nr:hypothetical protein T06_5256 [Trichinella sp. T6]